MNHENVKVSFMKVIKYFYILLFVGALISCKKLDEKPVSVFTTSQFYKTKEDAIAYRDREVIPAREAENIKIEKKARDIEFERGLRDKLNNNEKEEVLEILRKFEIIE